MRRWAGSPLRPTRTVLLTAPAATYIPEPGDTDLNAFYELHKKDYDAPEVRAVDYFVLSAASLAKVDDISDDDAKKEYDAHPERWTTEETRHLEQIVFKDRAEADAAVAALAAGKTFDELLTERLNDHIALRLAGVIEHLAAEHGPRGQ